MAMVCRGKKIIAAGAAILIFSQVLNAFSVCAQAEDKKEDVITLKVCNWEEYIDLGDWDDEEKIELDNGAEIFGDRPIYKEFEDWYYENYGQRVKVEYSCFGTNEDLYNQLTIGDSYDLVCPSDYMIMKLMAEKKLQRFSDEFFDKTKEDNYYIKGVSPYINQVFEENEINGEAWEKYAACYMWGVTGVLYNPEYVADDEADTWAVFDNPKFFRRVTLKDNVRDTYFATLGYMKADELLDSNLRASADYNTQLADIMNDVSAKTINDVQDQLQKVMGNIYALETDSGKADMITGKIVANYQWSGDAVYAMDQAQEEGTVLKFAVPRECTNLWFDGWLMLKDGVGKDKRKQQAAEAFVNYLSRPDNAVRNMYYIGYTSAIAGGDDDTVYSYLNYCYGDDEADETVDYPVGYFFSGKADDEDYIVRASSEQVGRQLYTQYPSQEVIARAAIMGYFDLEQTKLINQMWINVRCYNLKNVPVWAWIAGVITVVAGVVLVISKKRKQY